MAKAPHRFPTDKGHRKTLGELRAELAGYPDEAEVTFGCTMAGTPLVFYRVKERGPVDAAPADRLVQIELNELQDEDPPG